MKNVVKFKFYDKEGFLSVVEKEDKYYALVQKDTQKIAEIQNTNKLLLSYDLKVPKYSEVFVKVIFDKEIVKWVYEKLEEEKNLYFKQLDDSLCVIEFANNK